MNEPEEHEAAEIGCVRHVSSPVLEESSSEDELFVPQLDAESSDDYDTDLEGKEETKEPFDSAGKKVYLEVCKDLNVIPCSPFLRQLHREDVNVSHYNIGPVGCEAVAVALMKNTNVVTLNISDNAIGGEGATFVAKLLTENCFISELDVSQNQLGTQGAYAIAEMLRDNTDLVELNLAANQFKERDFEPFVEALRENYTVKTLNLSGNSFDSTTGMFFGPAIADNVGLEVLDLSWNNIRGKGAQIIGEALRKNCSLKVLDLSWNGFGDEGVAAVCEALSVNDCLEEIDLTSNRITTQGARAFAKALGVNTGLQVVRLGKNSFKWTFALEIVKAAVRNEEGSAQEFYFDDMPVTKQFEEALEEIVASYPDLVVQCGTSLRGKAREKKKRRKRDLLNQLLEYIELRGMRMIDMFKLLDKDNNNSVTHDEIMAGLKRTGLPMTNAEIRRLITLLDRNNDGAISYKEFLAIRKQNVFKNFHSRRKSVKTNDPILKRKISYLKK